MADINSKPVVISSTKPRRHAAALVEDAVSQEGSRLSDEKPGQSNDLVKFVELLFFAYRDFTGDADELLADLKYGRAHHRVIHFVARHPGLRVADLLDILRITKQSLARVLKQLIEEGFVTQQSGKTDRRERHLYLTQKGRNFAEKLTKLQCARIGNALETVGLDGKDRIEAFLVAMISDHDQAAVAALLEKAARNEQMSNENVAPNSQPAPQLASRTAKQPEPLADDAPHVLVVDDDERIRGLLTRYLTNQGFRVTPAPDAAVARSAMMGLQFDIVILDVMMPGESGLDLARFLKSQSDVPICMLTAQSEAEHRILGLEAGVDDYLPKPFEPRELLLRLQNILKRGVAPPAPPADEIHMGEMTFHVARGELRRGDKSIKLTERERDLLRMFAGRKGDSIARHELAADESTGSERAIDVQINRLRRKIEIDPSNPVYLQTVRGKGYILYAD